MKIFGAWMIAWGVISLLIGFVGLRVGFLFFLDEFGTTVGYFLKVALILAGAWVWRRDGGESVEEDVSEEESRRAWIPVAICCLLFVGVVSLIGISEFKKRGINKLVNRPVEPTTWSKKPTGEWPCLVLLQRAAFKSHSQLDAGCASIARLPTGEIALLTAGHLLGKDGGVSPGFLRSSYGGLDAKKLGTLDMEIVNWRVFAPDDTNVTARVTGLYGKPDQFEENCDQVLLRVSPGNAAGYPVPPLSVRMEPVAMNETVYVVAVGFDDEGNLRQQIHKAKRVAGLGLTCAFENGPVDLNGNSGAPVLDSNGSLVGIVTGRTLMDLQNQSPYSRAFSGHTVGELLPVFRQEIKDKGVAEPVEVKAVVRIPKSESVEKKDSGILTSNY